MFECVKKGMREMLRSRLRAFLTIGSISVGVLSVVLISSIGDMGKSMIDSQLVSMGMDSVVVSGDSDNYTGLNESDLEVLKSMDSVDNAMPLMNLYTKTRVKDQNIQTMVWGVNEDADQIISLVPVYGRLVNKGDIISKSKVCVVDEQIAVDTYKRKNIVGKTVSVNINGSDEDFTVIGVVKNGVNALQNMLGDVIPSFVYVPYTTLSTETSQRYFNQIAVKVKDDSNFSSEELEREISFNKDMNVNVSVENLLKQKSQMNQIMDIITLVLSVIAGISIIVSGMSIMNVMLVSVKERTREIGIKKSIGATNFNIMSEFLSEAVLITVIGGLAGCTIGTVLSFAGSLIIGMSFTLNLKTIITVLLFSLFIGLIFGGYPAYRAAKLKPVEALRSF